MPEIGELLGIVRNREFVPLNPTRASARLTRIAMQEARAPDCEEIHLDDHEGKALMVRGLDSGGWIYSASIIDQAGPILTAVVEHLFANGRERA